MHKMRLVLPKAYSVQFTKATVLLLLLIIVATYSISNGIYYSISIINIVIILRLLWKQSGPSILPFAFLMQWVQVFSFVIWMSVRGWSMDHIAKSGAYAFIAANVGLLIMAIVIRFVGNGIERYFSLEALRNRANLTNEKKVLLLYIFSTLFLSGIGFVFGRTSGVAQMLVSISKIKWVFFIWYSMLIILKGKNKSILLLIILFEFTNGLYSYFSSFKDVIFYAIIVLLTFIRKVNLKQTLYFLGIGFFLVFLFLTWTSIKGAYREFLNQGSRQQVVSVSRDQAFSEISSRINEITWIDYQRSMNMALYRIQYIMHLAIVMDRIPEIMPYEKGALWWENISFVFTPRILFPDKSIYEATEKTNKYTGLHYAGARLGASFSLGYFADSYVDFGWPGMYLPLIIMGLMVGFFYKSILNLKEVDLIPKIGIVTVVLINFTSFEADGLFLFGRLLTDFLVYWLLGYLLFPLIARYTSLSNK